MKNKIAKKDFAIEDEDHPRSNTFYAIPESVVDVFLPCVPRVAVPSTSAGDQLFFSHL